MFELNSEWDGDGCIIIKRCDEDAVDQIMADFVPVTLTCIPDDAILVQVHTLDRGSILEEEL